MKTSIRTVFVALSLLAGGIQLRAQGTAFTYQGRLSDNTGAASGAYDFRFRLAADALGNTLVAGPLLTNAVPVAGGLFAVTLNFGPGIFAGSNYWLQVDVKTNGAGSYTTLTPLQAVTPAPYAIMANSASNLLGTLPAGQLTGALPSSQLSGVYGSAITFDNAANNFSGTFGGNGAGVTNVNAATLGGLSRSSFWITSGNAGTTAGTHFLGTTDNQVLELKVNGTRALRIEPNTNGAPNFIGGAPINQVDAGVVGSTIAGGGAVNYFGDAFSNRISTDFSFIGGGIQNTIQNAAFDSTIGGGAYNTIQTYADDSTIGGGAYNTVQTFASLSTIGGGYGNRIYTNARQSTIGGGGPNTIQANASYSTIGGGSFNLNTGPYSAISGGDYNLAGTNSFAAGHRAKATHTGSFVWADLQDADFSTTATNQFLIRASGGAGFVTSGAGMTLDGQPVLSGTVNSAQLANGSVTAAKILSGQVVKHINSLTDDVILAGGSNVTITPSGNTLQIAANFSGPVSDSQLSANIARRAGNQSFSGSNTFGNSVTIAAPATLAFGSSVRQMLNLWGTEYGIGVQSSTVYFRTDNASGAQNGFAWYKGGTHNDAAQNPGGGATMMKLDGTGLTVNGTFVSASDRNAKENFKPVDSRAVLDKVAALPLSEWNYKTDTASRHLGPMAQDFYAAFNVGPDDKHIAVVDESGVALAAIQGLNQKVEDLNGQLKRRDTENTELKQRLERLEQLIDSKNGPTFSRLSKP